MDDIEIVAGDQRDGREIESNLLDSLCEALPQSANERFMLCVRWWPEEHTGG